MSKVERGLPVSNTTPITHLHRIGYLHLLHAVHGPMVIPRAVAFELAGPHVPDPLELSAFPWLAVVDVAVPDHLARGLDPGESAAIALAMRTHASVLVLDEKNGRTRAVSLGLPITGTLAVVGRAKLLGVIPSARVVMDALTATGFRAAPSLVAEILRQAGE
jgi:hypothetical protein